MVGKCGLRVMWEVWRFSHWNIPVIFLPVDEAFRRCTLLWSSANATFSSAFCSWPSSISTPKKQADLGTKWHTVVISTVIPGPFFVFSYNEWQLIREISLNWHKPSQTQKKQTSIRDFIFYKLNRLVFSPCALLQLQLRWFPLHTLDRLHKNLAGIETPHF